MVGRLPQPGKSSPRVLGAGSGGRARTPACFLSPLAAVRDRPRPVSFFLSTLLCLPLAPNIIASWVHTPSHQSSRTRVPVRAFICFCSAVVTCPFSPLVSISLVAAALTWQRALTIRGRIGGEAIYLSCAHNRPLLAQAAARHRFALALRHIAVPSGTAVALTAPQAVTALPGTSLSRVSL